MYTGVQMYLREIVHIKTANTLIYVYKTELLLKSLTWLQLLHGYLYSTAKPFSCFEMI